MKIKAIIEGWRNHLIPPKDIKELITAVSEERLAICKECPFHSDNAKKTGYKTNRIDRHCTKCSCVLSAKTKALSTSCPIDKWGVVLTDEEKAKMEQAIKDKNNEEQ